MALSPQEELELLELEEQESQAAQVPGDGFMKRSAKSLVGSSALPIAGGVVGGVVGGIPGAALGGAAGESFRQLGARAMGMEAPETSMSAAKDIGVEGITQGLGEAGGKLITPAARLAGKIPGVKATGRFAKKTTGDLFQLITKIKPRDAATLFENPKAILPGTMSRASKVWRTVAEAAGLPVDDVSPEIINALKKDARTTVFDTFEKIKAGEAVSAAEAQTAKQALDIALMPAAKTERNKPLVTLYGKMRDQFTEKISKESSELAAANKQYGIAKAGERFKSLFPRNLDNSPAYFRSSLLPTAAFGLGSREGNFGEGALAAGGLIAATSPIAIGSAIATGGGVRAALPYLKRPVSAAFANLVKNKFKGQ